MGQSESNEDVPTPQQPKSNLTVDDLLRKTEDKVTYDPSTEAMCRIIFSDLGDRVPGAYLVHNLLSPSECKQYIDLSEKLEYEPAPLRNLNELNSTNFTRDASTNSIRNSLRVMLDVPDDIGKVLEQRLLPHMPQYVTCNGYRWTVHRDNPINKRWRFNRYDEGQYFKPHFDAGYVYKPNEDMTLFTFILYLNDGFEGGETVFFPGGRKRSFDKAKDNSPDEVKVVPQIGSALCFFQDGELSPFHEGVALRGNIPKYILRSDLRYVRVKDAS
eukprot:TRINITY_DN1202_c0_g1_i1.p1 TRINITY_DN1202_c0_g1~~TRINITY_DN1202_c0_g1_i1.p1  ORF type:complete len:272 (-),score=36.07 TRINITY_DN1202_c0_g1_i1:149-964(-)